LLLALIIASAGWLIFVNRVRVIGIGYVVAEESIVSSQFEGKVTALYVACNDRVKAGDPVGVVEDFIRNGKYREELAELEAMYAMRRITHDTRTARGRTLVELARRKAAATQKRLDNATALKKAVEAAHERQNATLKERMRALNEYAAATGVHAVAEADTLRRQAELAKLEVEEKAQLDGFAERLDSQRRLVALGEENVARAPFDGVVTACPRTVGEVVNPGIALARIQRENAARILIWVPVQELNRVRAGMKVDVFLSESAISLTGTVRTLPVEVGPLPDRLRRYFWQNQRWQQYAPLEVIPDAGAVGLYGNARIDAVIHLYDNFKGGTEIFRPL
jgi:multidrug efflux pump subunit AcrA (membrane-fusion protein)